MLCLNALNVPETDTYIGLMHTLFALEDIYGLTIEKRDGEILMHIDPFKSREARNLLDELPSWCEMREKYRKGEISNGHWVKVPSKELSDALIEAFKDIIKE